MSLWDHILKFDISDDCGIVTEIIKPVSVPSDEDDCNCGSNSSSGAHCGTF